MRPSQWWCPFGLSKEADTILMLTSWLLVFTVSFHIIVQYISLAKMHFFSWYYEVSLQTQQM